MRSFHIKALHEHFAVMTSRLQLHVHSFFRMDRCCCLNFFMMTQFCDLNAEHGSHTRIMELQSRYKTKLI